MSDYFASLMRASAGAGPGMAAGAPAAPPFAAADVAARQAMDATPATTLPATPSAEAAPAGAAAASERTAPPLATGSASVAALPTRDVIVHAAMRWVAAGEASGAPAAASPPRSRPAESATPARLDDAASTLPAIARTGDERAGPAVDRRVDTPAATPARPAVAAQATLSRAPLPASGDIEVSIGAIHLRVDAPAVSAAVAPTPRPQRVAVPSAPAHGSLARRALRRL